MREDLKAVADSSLNHANQNKAKRKQDKYDFNKVSTAPA